MYSFHIQIEDSFIIPSLGSCNEKFINLQKNLNFRHIFFLLHNKMLSMMYDKKLQTVVQYITSVIFATHNYNNVNKVMLVLSCEQHY